MKKIIAVAGATATLLVASACGADRPSADALAEAIENQGGESLPVDADCVADLLVDSDISDDTLNDIADEEIDITGFVVRMPEDDMEAWEAISDDIIECATN